MRSVFFCLLLITGCSTQPVIHGVPNFAVVDPARNIVRGGQPTADGWVYLSRLGITNVVKLNLESESSDARAQALGMQIIRCPIPFRQQLFGPVNYDALTAAIRRISPGTFIHCEHGQDRTGLAVAFYREQSGWTKQQAEWEMLQHGFHKILRGLWECFEDYP